MDFEFTEVDVIDKVPEQFRGLYKQIEDKKFNLDPAFKGVADAVNGLNKSLKAAREESKRKTPIDLSLLHDYGDTVEAIKAGIETKVKALQDEIAKGGEAKLNLDKVRAEMAEANSKALKQAGLRSEALQNQLYQLMVENAATAAVAELKGVPDLLLPFIKNQVKVVDQDGAFKVFVVDAQGDQRYSGVTGQPMTIKELVTEMKANEKYGRLFESEAAPGGGMKPGGGTRAPLPTGMQLTANEKIAAGLAKGQYRGGR